MKSSLAARGILSGVAFLAAAAMFFVVFGAVSADATSPKITVSGNANFTFGSGKAGKALRGKVAAAAPAKAKRQGKNVQVTAPVRSFNGDVTLGGGIRFKSGKRKVTVTGLLVKVGENRTVIKGKLGKKAITAFNVAGKSVTSGDTANGSVRITTGKLALSGAAAKAVKQALKLKSLPAGQVGAFALFAKIETGAPNPDPCVLDPTAEGCTPVDPCIANPQAEECDPNPPTDPYFEQCAVAATSQVAGSLPAAAPLPTLAGEVQPIESPVTWGFKASFRGYLSAPFGRMIGLDGATVNPPPAGPVPTGFTFPAAAGQYTPNSSATTADDQAIINGTGSVLFCHREQFRILLSNPTIVLDGADSRLVVDIDTNNKGVWTTTQRIDLAELDAGAGSIEITEDGTIVNWDSIPVSLTETGSTALGLCDTAPGAPPTCAYGPGAAMDPISFSVSTEEPVAMCSIPQTTGFTTPPTVVPGTVAPILTSPVSATGGQLEWGFRRSFRGTVNTNGHFGLANGALRSDPTDMSEAAPTPPAKTAKFFTWPAVGGDYQAVAAGDDRLVLNGSGTISFCNPTHGYGAIISDPTIVVDGANSFISADVAIRVGVDWESARVDVVRFNLAGVDPVSTPVSGGTQLAWTVDTVSPAGPGGSPSSLLGTIGAGHAGFDWLSIKATIAD